MMSLAETYKRLSEGCPRHNTGILKGIKFQGGIDGKGC
jgi:hypothetical protein